MSELLVERMALIENQIATASPDDAERLQELRDDLATQFDQVMISGSSTAWVRKSSISLTS